ncbi:MAG: hypothetical protein LC777_09605, partial [Actinobacteria bacterium]|nr:hypothetical protein [Actinomycetota bacterium]
PEKASAWLTALEGRFRCLLARTERQRNAIVHGQRPTEGVLASIDEFVRDLGRLVAQESMRSAETGQPPLSQLERWRVDLLEEHARLSAGESPLQVLFE